MNTFFRKNFTTMFINVESNEALGLLETDYIEDYFGVNGQISLLNETTGIRYAVPVVSVPSITPSIANDYFRGSVALSTIPDGVYQLQFRVRDIGGNFVISGAVSSPIGSETIRTIELAVKPGFGDNWVVDGILVLRGGLDVPRDVRRVQMTILLGQ